VVGGGAYVVAETLTNTTKHTEASRTDVTVELRDGRLWVCARDDGIGGADPACRDAERANGEFRRKNGVG
jgi:signal transduction histidine kinase